MKLDLYASFPGRLTCAFVFWNLLEFGCSLEIINISCQSINTSGGYTYSVSSSVPQSYIWNRDCEQAWKTPDGDLLADGSPFAQHINTERRFVGVTPANLTTTECINGILYEMICHALQYSFRAIYQVTSESIRNDTNITPVPEGRSHYCIFPAPILFLVLLIVWFLLKGRFQRPNSDAEEVNNRNEGSETHLADYMNP